MYYIDIGLFKTFSDDHHRHLYKGVSPPPGGGGLESESRVL